MGSSTTRALPLRRRPTARRPTESLDTPTPAPHPLSGLHQLLGNQALQRAARHGALTGLLPRAPGLGNQALQRLACGGAFARPSGGVSRDTKATGQAPVPDDEDADRRAPVAGAPASGATVQRTIGDGHDLASARFKGDPVLEAVFDNERLLKSGDSGPAVKKVQEALIAFGHPLPKFGADGVFGGETKTAVKDFQRAAGLTGKDIDGIIGPITMGKLDTHGGSAPTPPGPTPPGPTPPGPTPPGPTPPGPTPPGPTPPTPTVIAVLPPRIRAASTPAAMAADRIPPRVATPVPVIIAGITPPLAPAILSVEGAGGPNGSALVNGLPSIPLTSSAVVDLTGLLQTAPGNAGKLRLVVRHGGTVLATSGSFSVSAIPQNYTDVFLRELTGPSRGFVVQDGWSSDSGDVADLDQAAISEEVETTVATGCFTGLGVTTSGYLPANSFTTDTHSTPVSIMTSDGTRIAQQTCKFKDDRTGAIDIPMKNSGYELTRVVTRHLFGAVTTFKLTKQGKATTANGITSGAGAGSITRTQLV